MPAHRPRNSKDPEDNCSIEVGQLLRQRVMGTDALYRVVERVDRGVRVEVVEAPGLEQGAQFVFSAEAVSAMEVLYAEPGRPPAPGRSSVIRHRLA